MSKTVEVPLDWLEHLIVLTQRYRATLPEVDDADVFELKNLTNFAHLSGYIDSAAFLIKEAEEEQS